ncbi:MAG: hypothetical protein AAFX81_17995 [Pseudomonadota bacterium]
MNALGRFASILTLLLALVPVLAKADPLDPFLGRWVGAAELADHRTGTLQERDVDTIVKRESDGFRLEWSSVIRSDGRRDVPGVRYVEREVLLTRAADRPYFMQTPEYDPFRKRQSLTPMAGDALGWATVTDGTLDLFVFGITQDGAAELQHHRRVLTDDGMDLFYTGFVAGEQVADGSGRLVRVD